MGWVSKWLHCVELCWNFMYGWLLSDLKFAFVWSFGFALREWGGDDMRWDERDGCWEVLVLYVYVIVYLDYRT
jgi:hypothetical protein